MANRIVKHSVPESFVVQMPSLRLAMIAKLSNTARKAIPLVVFTHRLYALVACHPLLWEGCRMKKLIALAIVVAIVGGIGPLVGSASAAGPAPAQAPVSASAVCSTLPELNLVRQNLAKQALGTPDPDVTYRTAVTKAASMSAAQPSGCTSGLRTALLADGQGRTLIRLGDYCCGAPACDACHAFEALQLANEIAKQSGGDGSSISISVSLNPTPAGLAAGAIVGGLSAPLGAKFGTAVGVTAGFVGSMISGGFSVSIGGGAGDGRGANGGGGSHDPGDREGGGGDGGGGN